MEKQAKVHTVASLNDILVVPLLQHTIIELDIGGRP
jgi:hypothetical protein